jgi:acetolactate synthase I/II/III large subunit
MPHPRIKLRELLSRPGPVIAPGAYDAISVRAVEHAVFEAAYMTGSGVSAAPWSQWRTATPWSGYAISSPPVLYGGGGLVNSGPQAWAAFTSLARGWNLPTTLTLMGLGAIPAAALHGAEKGNDEGSESASHRRTTSSRAG